MNVKLCGVSTEDKEKRYYWWGGSGEGIILGEII